MTLTGLHTCKVTAEYGDWRIHDISMGQDVYIDLQDIEHLLTEPVELDLGDIAWKGRHLPQKFIGKNCVCCGGTRYMDCDVSYPGIVVEGINNPYNLPYRLIDGKHRCQKLFDSRVTKGLFYVLTRDTLMDYTRITERTQ